MMPSLRSHLSFTRLALARLVALALALCLLWWLAAPAGLSPREQQMWKRVSAAQQYIQPWRIEQGGTVIETEDPWGCGLIGLEWSEISTTLGDVKSKRTACHPAWAIQFTRWFREKGLVQGDGIAIYSSASFPGLLLSAITAAEAMQLDILLVVSLSASSWGANDPATPWPLLADEWRRADYLSTRSDFYTLGGASELGHDLSPRGLETLRSAAQSAGVEILNTDNLQSMIELKSKLLVQRKSRLLLSIGGSHANLGDDPDVLRLNPGPLAPADSNDAGNGVIAAALEQGIPVIHMLNLRELSRQTGIPFDSRPLQRAPGRISSLWSAAGVLLFFLVVARHRRWRIED